MKHQNFYRVILTKIWYAAYKNATKITSQIIFTPFFAVAGFLPDIVDFLGSCLLELVTSNDISRFVPKILRNQY